MRQDQAHLYVEWGREAGFDLKRRKAPSSARSPRAARSRIVSARFPDRPQTHPRPTDRPRHPSHHPWRVVCVYVCVPTIRCSSMWRYWTNPPKSQRRKIVPRRASSAASSMHASQRGVFPFFDAAIVFAAQSLARRMITNLLRKRTQPPRHTHAYIQPEKREVQKNARSSFAD